MACENIKPKDQWTFNLHEAAQAGDTVRVWNCVKRITACEVSLLDFGETFYIAEDLATDIASYLVFDRGLVKEWLEYSPNQTWVYIGKAVTGFVWKHHTCQTKIRTALAWKGIIGGDSAYRLTGPRLRKLVRSGQLFLLTRLFNGVERTTEVECLINYLTKTMIKVISNWPKYELLRCYLSLQAEVYKHGNKQSSQTI